MKRLIFHTPVILESRQLKWSVKGWSSTLIYCILTTFSFLENCLGKQWTYFTPLTGAAFSIKHRPLESTSSTRLRASSGIFLDRTIIDGAVLMFVEFSSWLSYKWSRPNLPEHGIRGGVCKSESGESMLGTTLG